MIKIITIKLPFSVSTPHCHRNTYNLFGKTFAMVNVVRCCYVKAVSAEIRCDVMKFYTSGVYTDTRGTATEKIMWFPVCTHSCGRNLIRRIFLSCTQKTKTKLKGYTIGGGIGWAVFVVKVGGRGQRVNRSKELRDFMVFVFVFLIFIIWKKTIFPKIF